MHLKQPFFDDGEKSFSSSLQDGIAPRSSSLWSPQLTWPNGNGPTAWRDPKNYPRGAKGGGNLEKKHLLLWHEPHCFVCVFFPRRGQIDSKSFISISLIDSTTCLEFTPRIHEMWQQQGPPSWNMTPNGAKDLTPTGPTRQTHSMGQLCRHALHESTIFQLFKCRYTQAIFWVL